MTDQYESRLNRAGQDHPAEGSTAAWAEADAPPAAPEAPEAPTVPFDYYGDSASDSGAEDEADSDAARGVDDDTLAMPPPPSHTASRRSTFPTSSEQNTPPSPATSSLEDSLAEAMKYLKDTGSRVTSRATSRAASRRSSFASHSGTAFAGVSKKFKTRSRCDRAAGGSDSAISDSRRGALSGKLWALQRQTEGRDKQGGNDEDEDAEMADA